MSSSEDQTKKVSVSALIGRLLPYAVVAAFALACYANTLANGFVRDDLQLVLGDRRIRSLSNIPSFFTEPYLPSPQMGPGAVYYRPIVTLSFALDYPMGGEAANPWTFHMGNILAYTACAVLVYALLRRLIGGGAAALFGGVFFAVHPVHVESVAWLSGRTDVLACLFMCISLMCLLWGRSAGQGEALRRGVGASGRHGFGKVCIAYGGAFIGMLAALFCKEAAFALIPIYAVYELSARRGSRGAASPLRAGMGLLVLACAGAVFLVCRGAAVGAVGTHLSERYFVPWTLAGMATVANCVLQYLGKLAFPANLSAQFEVEPFRTVLALSPAVSLGTVIGLAALSVHVTVKNGRAGFALWWVWLSLLPVLTLAPIAETAAERFAFIPSVGFCLFLGLVLERALHAGSLTDRRLSVGAVAAGGLLVCSGMIITLDRNADWKSRHRLGLSDVRTAPDVARSHVGLGGAYATELRVPRRAVLHLRRAIELAPASARACNDLGKAAADSGDLTSGVRYLRRAVELWPGHPLPWSNLARTLVQLGQRRRPEAAWTKGREAAERALQLDPTWADAHFLVGSYYLDYASDLDRAKKAFDAALKESPNHYEARFALSLLYFKQGDFESALREAHKALRIRPSAQALLLIEQIKKRSGDVRK